MTKDTKDTSLVKVNLNSIFYKLKQLFKKLFHKNEPDKALVAETPINNIKKGDNTNKFLEELKIIEDEETILLKLQKKYRSGEIKEENLSPEQVKSLCELYDRQISDLRRSNERRKQKLLEQRKKLQMNN